jgi:hypothetical protein
LDRRTKIYFSGGRQNIGPEHSRKSKGNSRIVGKKTAEY